MGKSDPIVFNAYKSSLENKTYESIAFLGFGSRSSFTDSISGNQKDFYDLSLNNWEINTHPWDINKKYDLVVCTRCAYFSRDPKKFLNEVVNITRPGGAFLVDWGLGDHWRFKDYKIGWVKNKEQEYAYHDKNYLWSTVWHDEFKKASEFQKFSKWVKKFDYDSVKDAIYKEVPVVLNLSEMSDIRMNVSLLCLWEDRPQLYIIVVGKTPD